MQDHTKIDTWQKGIALSSDIRKLCIRHGRRGYGDLSEQLRKSASSVPSNIAEGAGALTNREFYKFLRDALKSNTETDNHLREARETGFLPARTADELLRRNTEVRKMLTAFMQSVSRQVDDRHDLGGRRERPREIPDTDHSRLDTGHAAEPTDDLH